MVEWEKMTADDILLRHHVFGALWDESFFNELDSAKTGTRVIFERLGKVEVEEVTADNSSSIPSGYAMLMSDGPLERIIIKAAENTFVELEDCTIAGESRGSGRSLRKLKQLLQAK